MNVAKLTLNEGEKKYFVALLKKLTQSGADMTMVSIYGHLAGKLQKVDVFSEGEVGIMKMATDMALKAGASSLSKTEDLSVRAKARMVITVYEGIKQKLDEVIYSSLPEEQMEKIDVISEQAE